MPLPLPAWQTKHVSRLEYKVPSGRVVHVAQDDTRPDSTGRTVWLGAQVLSVVLHDVQGRSKRRTGRRKKLGRDGLARGRGTVIDVGSGTGLLAMSLASEGYDVVAPDVSAIARGPDGLLYNNAMRFNEEHGRVDRAVGRIESRTLDWFDDVDGWDFRRRDISGSGFSMANENERSNGSGELTEGVVVDDGPWLAPPFELITTSDSVYEPALIKSLLRTLFVLASRSSPVTEPTMVSSKGDKTGPKKNEPMPAPVYVALERRDPAVVDDFLLKARTAGTLVHVGAGASTGEKEWTGFSCVRVDAEHVSKLVRAKLGWSDEDWDGIEVYEMTLCSKVPAS